mmetsp:Transcript_29776/g.60037  ORF Transcript_29776/g.60037 Transcript_29776/m.60037 type:complete len:106 (-) Transcript_29776:346-663(-)
MASSASQEQTAEAVRTYRRPAVKVMVMTTRKAPWMGASRGVREQDARDQDANSSEGATTQRMHTDRVIARVKTVGALEDQPVQGDIVRELCGEAQSRVEEHRPHA